MATIPARIVIRTNAGEHAHTLQVIDDGPGISPQLRGRVFEPFFTTKDVGQGTGLGLSIALGIATSHGGSLELQDRGGKGACFQLTLPVHAQVTAAVSRVSLTSVYPPRFFLISALRSGLTLKPAFSAALTSASARS